MYRKLLHKIYNLLLLFVSSKYPQRKNQEESSVTKGDVVRTSF